MNNKSNKMFSEEDMKRYATENPHTKVIKFDDIPDAEVSLPDVNELSTNIINLLEYMNNEDVITIMVTDKNQYEKLIFDKFPLFSDKYYSLFKGLQDCDDISKLTRILSDLEKIKQNKTTFETVANRVDNELFDKYVKGKISKSKFNEIKQKAGINIQK